MMNKLFCLLAILIVVPLTSQDKLTAQTAADSAVIVRISSGTRYYYGRFNNNAVTNGDTLQYVFTLMSPKDTLLLRDHSQGGIFQGAFTDNAAGYYVKGGYYGNATAWISADETDGYSVLDSLPFANFHLSPVGNRPHTRKRSPLSKIVWISLHYFALIYWQCFYFGFFSF